MNAIEVNQLRRVYKTIISIIRRKVKEVVAVDGISFDVREGELFGLLGPNSAGKTTTVKMLTTLLIPTGGKASILGQDVVKDADKIRPRIGFIYCGERWTGTLPYLFGTSANLMAMFTSRSLVHILAGMPCVFIGLRWGMLLFGLDLTKTNLPALAIVIMVTTFSTASLGLLMGCLSLITRNLMLVNNTVYFLWLLFSGANLVIETLPKWMQVVSRGLPLTRGVTASRVIINSGTLQDVQLLMRVEFIIGLGFAILGYVMFRVFETTAKKLGTLDIF